MHALPTLIYDLALILATAAFAAIFFRKIKQPIVLGYLVAGFFVGPSLNIFPTVADPQSVQVWAELGVIFLLFALGLEFSFKKLAKEGSSTGVVASIEVVGMYLLGFTAGKALGWSNMDSLFLGGIVSISSTSIILRVVDELGMKNKKFVSHVFGILIFEDIAAVLILVLLSTLAVSQKFAGLEMLGSMLKLGFFLGIWFLGGVFVLPGFMKRISKTLSDEMGLVLGLGICLLMAVFASEVGFSSALGAFIAGSILCETQEGERIHHVVAPVRDLFSAIFFVSVGMLINPQIIFENLALVLILSAVVVFGKTILVSVSSVLVGQTVKNSVSSAMSMSQIGEFSFIIATLGTGLGVISPKIYPLAVAVSVVTSFLTPVLIRHSEGVTDFIVQGLPQHWVRTMDEYTMFRVRASGEDEVRQALRSYVIRLLSNATIVVALFLIFAKLVLPWLLERQFAESTAKLIVIIAQTLLSAPFLWAISFGRMKSFEIVFSTLGADGRPAPLRIFIISRVVISVVLFTFMIAQYISAGHALLVTGLALVLVGYVLNRQMGTLYHRFEDQFLSNLKGEEKAHKFEVTAEVKKSKAAELAPWDAHIVEFIIQPEWKHVGSKLSEIRAREEFGVSITLIERGRKVITAPKAQEVLMPHDVVYVLGTEDQLEKFQQFLNQHEELSLVALEAAGFRFGLEPVLINDTCRVIGKSIREANIREIIGGMLVGIERNNQRLLNPPSDTLIENGDLLWLVGDRDLIQKFRQEQSVPGIVS